MKEYEQDGMIVVEEVAHISENDWSRMIKSTFTTPYWELPHLGMFAGAKHDVSLAESLLAKNAEKWAEYIATVVKEQS